MLTVGIYSVTVTFSLWDFGPNSLIHGENVYITLSISAIP